jgi:glycosyltransferase involved in cell wall biosynthesis
VNQEQKHVASESVRNKHLRPALIASERTVREYPRSIEHLLIGLADESVPVALVCPPGCDTDALFTGTAEVIQYPVFELPLMGHLNRRLLAERLSRFKPTVLHCLCESKARLVRRLARRLDLPYVLAVNSLQKHMVKFSVSSKRCTRIVVPSKSIAANVARTHPESADRIEQINIGTFASQAPACFSEPSELATIMTAHPPNNADDFEHLFRAIKHLLIDGYEFLMVVVGGGRADRQLWKLTAALGLLQTVIIVPRLRPWRSVLAAADIFIQPQPSSAFNPLLLEAMSVGVAVAGCKGGVDDLITKDKTAVVFDPKDELSIMRSLQRLLDRREFARQIAGAAQQYLRENHTVSKMISSTLHVYHEAKV